MLLATLSVVGEGGEGDCVEISELCLLKFMFFLEIGCTCSMEHQQQRSFRYFILQGLNTLKVVTPIAQARSGGRH